MNIPNIFKERIDRIYLCRISQGELIPETWLQGPSDFDRALLLELQALKARSMGQVTSIWLGESPRIKTILGYLL